MFNIYFRLIDMLSLCQSALIRSNQGINGSIASNTRFIKADLSRNEKTYFELRKLLENEVTPDSISDS